MQLIHRNSTAGGEYGWGSTSVCVYGALHCMPISASIVSRLCNLALCEFGALYHVALCGAGFRAALRGAFCTLPKIVKDRLQ